MPSYDTSTVKEQDRLKNRRTALIIHIDAGNEEMRFTNWGRDINVLSGEALGNYSQVNNLNYEEVKRSLSLESSEMNLSVPLEGSLLQSRLIGNPTINITVKIWEVVKADLLGTTNEDNIKRIWYGKVNNLVITKSHAQMSVRSALDPEASIGRIVYQSQDQRNPSDIVEVINLKVTAAVTAISAIRDRTITMDYTPTDEGYFEGGFLIDANGLKVRIESVELLEGGGAELRVHFIPSDLQVSDDIDLYPGYDGTLKQAINKFPGLNLVDGFLGFPYIPSINPSASGV
jgi:hypothetical protein